MRMRVGAWAVLGAGLLSCVQGPDMEAAGGGDGPSAEAPGVGALTASPPPMCELSYPFCGGSCPPGEECQVDWSRNACSCVTSYPPVTPCGDAAYPACDGACEHAHQSCQAFPNVGGAGGAGQGECLCAGFGPGANLPEIP